MQNKKKNLIIIGAGSLGSLIYDVIDNDNDTKKHISLRGFVDDRDTNSLKNEVGNKIIGDPFTYQPEENDLFISALSNPKDIEKYVAPLIKKNAKFFSYTSQAKVSSKSTIGLGVYLGPNSSVSMNSKIGNFTFIDSNTIVGHDVEIGNYCFLGAMCFIAGHAVIDDSVTILPKSSVSTGVSVKKLSTIGLGSVVISDVSEKVTVFGNPAKVIFIQN